MGWRGKFLGGFLGGRPGTFVGDLIENAYKGGVRVSGPNDVREEKRPVYQETDITKACDDCGGPVRLVKRDRQLTGEFICLTCHPSDGTCPLCKSELRTPKAQQCPACKRSWHCISKTDSKNPGASQKLGDAGTAAGPR